MEHQDFLEVIAFFIDDINKGYATIVEKDSERIIIKEDVIFTQRIVNLNNKGYHVAIFGTKDQKVELIISKYQIYTE